jgi:cytochrome P450
MSDPLFEGDVNMIIDECLTFFVAGQLTTAVTTANTLCYMMMNPKIEHRLRASLAKNFKTFDDKNANLEDLCKEMKFEDLDLPEDDYLKLCFYESLRIEPPIPWSSTVCLTEDQTIGGVKVSAGDPIYVNTSALHHNEE